MTVIIASLALTACSMSDQQGGKNLTSASSHHAKWLAESSYGLMVHYLVTPKGDTPAEKTKYFNSLVDNFDMDYFIDQFNQTGADWLIFTIGQNTGYYISPNEQLDNILPGRTSRRDLILEVAKRLDEMDKRFIAYLPAENSAADPTLQAAFKWKVGDNYQKEFLNTYLKFLRTYSLKYGKYCDGWWFDGCYSELHHGNWDWQRFIDACRAGNPNTIVAFNDGAFCVNRIKPVTPLQDYHAGEVHMIENGMIRTDFINVKPEKNDQGYYRVNGKEPMFYMPDSQYIDGVQMHALLPLKLTFNPAIPDGCCTDEDLFRFVKDFKAIAGGVTINVPINEIGHIDDDVIEQLKRLTESISQP